MGTKSLYRNDDDRRDRQFRRSVNADRTYTDESCCEFCGSELFGSAFQCIKCGSLTCTSCTCEDGCCPGCVGSGKPDLPED